MPTAVTASLSDMPKPVMLQLTGTSTAAQHCTPSSMLRFAPTATSNKGAALRRATRTFTPSRGTTTQPYLS